MAADLMDDPRVPDAFDDLPLWSAHFGLALLARIPLVRGACVLDLGCGGGFPLLELARMLGPSGRLVGVDPWGHALRRAAFKRDMSGVPNAYLVRGDGASLPLREASVDLVVSNLGLNNFAEPAAVLAGARRVAKTGATLVLATNIRGHMAELYDTFRAVLTERGLASRLPALEAHEAHRGTVDSITALLEQARFHVETTDVADFTIRALDGTALFAHWLVRVGFLPAWRAVIEDAGSSAARGADAEAASADGGLAADDDRAAKDDRAADAALADGVLSALRERLDAIAAAQGELRVTVPRLVVVARAA